MYVCTHSILLKMCTNAAVAMMMMVFLCIWQVEWFFFFVVVIKIAVEQNSRKTTWFEPVWNFLQMPSLSLSFFLYFYFAQFCRIYYQRNNDRCFKTKQKNISANTKMEDFFFFCRRIFCVCLESVRILFFFFVRTTLSSFVLWRVKRISPDFFFYSLKAFWAHYVYMERYKPKVNDFLKVRISIYLSDGSVEHHLILIQ